MKFVTLWAGKKARTYLSTVEEDCKDSLRTVLDTLKDWTRPKSDEIAVFTHLRTLNQGNKTLSSYIQELRRVVDLCNFACVGDCKDRLIRNSIVAGLSSTKSYQQCISKGSSLTLNECIRICQTEDATCRQVQAPPTRVYRLHRQYASTPDSPISTDMPPGQTSGAEGATEACSEAWEVWPQGWHGRSLAPERLQAQY